MNAQEMFELVGYTQTKTDYSISYDVIGSEEKSFAFNLKEKYINIDPYFISIYEHKAIHQQCKELGWLE